MESNSRHVRPILNMRGESSSLSNFQNPSPRTARDRLDGPLETHYVSSLLQRHVIPEIPVVSDSLSAYQRRDLLQSRSSAIGRLKASDVTVGESALALAQQTMAWQLRHRVNKACGAVGRTIPAPTPLSAAESAKLILSSEMDKNLERRLQYERYRLSVANRTNEDIEGRRRPQTVYYEHPHSYSQNIASQIFPQEIRFPSAESSSGDALGVKSSGSSSSSSSNSSSSSSSSLSGIPSEDNPYKSLQFHENSAVNANGVWASPIRIPRAKRLQNPVVLTRPVSSLENRKGPIGRHQRPSLLTSSMENELAWNVSSSTPSSSAVAPCGAYRVLSSSNKLVHRFLAESAQDVDATIKVAGKLGVDVAVEQSNQGTGSSMRGVDGDEGGRHSEGHSGLPGRETLARALRPATTPEFLSRKRSAPAAAVAAAGQSTSKPAPPAPKAAGPAVPASATAPVPKLFTAGQMYSMNPFDREEQMKSLKDLIVKDYLKSLKASKPAAKK